MEQQIQWCIDRHKETNHFYDTYLPYEFHLRMVVQVCEDFSHLMPNWWDTVKLACWGHDLIEDTRCSYNDIKNILGNDVADIIYAVTNEKGKNRSERANDKYYNGITNQHGATFVKLCDRIANVQYSRLTKSKMLSMYRKENDNFVHRLRLEKTFNPMFEYLEKLLSYNHHSIVDDLGKK